MKPIKVLLVEDSIVQLACLQRLFNADPSLQLIATAQNGLEALSILETMTPDVIVMDLHMPKMDGVNAIKQIMQTKPLPIIAVSASGSKDMIVNSFNALHAGAVAFTEKPIGCDPQYAVLSARLIQLVKLMAEVKVVKRRPDEPPRKIVKQTPAERMVHLATKDIQVIAMGVSTGGPIILEKIFTPLGKDFPPILVVQHIAPGFIQGFCDWLGQISKKPVLLATDYQPIERGHIYLAPDYHQMGLTADKRIRLTPNTTSALICPSVSHLFHSVAVVMKNKAMGVLLTGMGSDGAMELKFMKELGAITIAQDEASSLVFGMARQAITLDAAMHVLNPEEITCVIHEVSTR